MSTTSTLAENLKAARAAAGLSQRALAQAAGIGQASLSEIETGTNPSPQIGALEKLAGALGTSVGGLLGEAPSDVRSLDGGQPTGPLRMIPLDKLVEWVDNPRKLDLLPGREDAQKIAELALSIAEEGLLQPLAVVGPDDGGFYQVIAGQRRHRALQGMVQPGMLYADHSVPCHVLAIAPDDTVGKLTAALAENLARRDMTPSDEARAFKALMAAGERSGGFPLDTATIAGRIGRTQRFVQKRLKLLELPKAALDALDAGQISVRQGEALLSAYDGVARAFESEDFKAATGRITGTLGHVVNGRLTTEIEIREQLAKLRDIHHRAQAEAAQADIEDGAKAAPNPDGGGWNEFGVAEHTRNVVLAQTGKVYLCARLALAPDGKWRAGYDFALAGMSVGCGSSSGAPALTDTEYFDETIAIESVARDAARWAERQAHHLSAQAQIVEMQKAVTALDQGGWRVPGELIEGARKALSDRTSALYVERYGDGTPADHDAAASETAPPHREQGEAASKEPKQWDELGITHAEWLLHQDALDWLIHKDFMVIGWENDGDNVPTRLTLRLPDGTRHAFETVGPVCRVCGCDEMRACQTEDGPCGWAKPDLCTACADAEAER